MSYDKRYYGLYQGFVKDTDDPEEDGRVRLTVPQVTGEVEWTGWAPSGAGGSIAQSNSPYGTFYTNSDQSIGVNTATLITNWIEADTNKAYLDDTKLYVEETGDYFLQFSAMLIKTNASTGTADIWIRKNGEDVEFSNTRITLSGSNAEIVMTVGIILDLDAGDYIQLVSSASSTNTAISHSSAGVGPAVPGVIATLHLVGKYRPKADQKVWVMYIGGDPNFPVWMGAQA
jgi:hypothetical protein